MAINRRLFRTDSGKWSQQKMECETWWIPLVGGFIMGLLIALGLFLGL